MSKVTFDASEKIEIGRKNTISQVQRLRSLLNVIEDELWSRRPSGELSEILDEIISEAHLLGMSVGLLAYNEALEEEYGSDD